MRNDLRCTCRKLLCQIEGDDVVIKCRHCKKVIYIHTRGLVSMEYRLEEPVVKINTLKEIYPSH